MDEPIPTKVLSVTVMVICHNGMTPAGVLQCLEHDNRFVSPRIVQHEVMEVPWTDEHPLNQTSGWKKAYFALFGGE